ncbi:acyltransferase family protein [Spirosoma jeollabukense]
MKPTTYLSSLTSLRGIAALLVIFLHIDGICFQLAPAGSHFFIRKGYLWVDFFFLLSGFIMVHVYGHSFSAISNLHLFKRFMWARFARIYPLHLFSFLCMVSFYFWYKATNTLTAFDHQLYNLNAIPTNLFLIHGLGVHTFLSWNAPSWSISTEWWMYVLFPLLMLFFQKTTPGKRLGMLWFIIAGYLFISYYLHPLSMAKSPYPDLTRVNSIDVTYDYGFVRCFFGFLFGMLIYDLYKIKWLYATLKSSLLWMGLVALIFITLSIHIPDMITVLLFAAIVLMSAYNSGAANVLLNLRPLVWLGDISYSLYLMHLPIMYFLLIYIKRFPSITFSASMPVLWLYSFAYITIVLLISALTYNVIELPMRKKLNQLAQHTRKPGKSLAS